MSDISKLPPEWWKDNARKDDGSNCLAGSELAAPTGSDSGAECEWIVTMVERHTTSVSARSRAEAIEKAQVQGFGGSSVCLSQSAKKHRNLNDQALRSARAKRVRVPLRIPLELGVKGAHISLVRGPLPYLWIGDKVCYGVVPDEQVARLKEMVKAI